TTGRSWTAASSAPPRAARYWALPASQRPQLIFQPATPKPPPRRSGRTPTPSPRRVRRKYQAALAVDRWTQPWETLARPWEPVDQGAAWTNSPELEIRTDQG